METIELIPFGIVLRDRYELMKKFELVDVVSGFHRMTEKARKNYDPISFMHYLQGKVEKPERITPKQKAVAPPDHVYFKDQPEKNKIVQEILAM